MKETASAGSRDTSLTNKSAAEVTLFPLLFPSLLYLVVVQSSSLQLDSALQCWVSLSKLSSFYKQKEGGSMKVQMIFTQPVL